MSRAAEQDDWRSKYYDSLKAVEEEGRQKRAQLQTLYRLVGKLCVAARGQSPRLDRELARLREAVRKEAPGEQLDLMSQAIVDAVQELDTCATGSSTQPAQPRPVVADGLAAAPEPAVAASSGEEQIRYALSGLLAELGREPGLAPAARTIDDELSAPLGLERFPELVERVGALVVQRITELEKSRKDLEELLNQLLGQLDSLTRYIAGQSAEDSDRSRCAETLNVQITGEVRAMGESVESGADLEQIRRQLRARLDSIGAHLQSYRQREEERTRQSRERTEDMRRRMEEMEGEARRLQARLSNEKRQSLRDPLTRIANRLAWDMRFSAEKERWKRFRHPTCVAAWDIDRFKTINDNYGHRAGDKVLTVVADALFKSIRSTDFVARYGGEEFVMLLPGSSLEEALRLANQIRESVARIGFHFRGDPVSVTISCGITEMREADEEDDAFDRADKAMYQAKQSGRNRVVSV